MEHQSIINLLDKETNQLSKVSKNYWAEINDQSHGTLIVKLNTQQKC